MKQAFFIALAALALGACNSPQKSAEKAQAPAVMVEANLKVEGMHCDDCEASIAKGVNELAGIDSISANHEDSTAFVRFDSNKTSMKDISKAIEGRGFVVASK